MNNTLPNFTRFLRQRPENEKDAEYYETNKQLAKDLGAKAMFEDRYDFWALVDQAPAELYGKKDHHDMSLDILWAEEQIDSAFQNA
tara:strand:- start:161 stop:418 length:258 start_codon:yes stop_codon:yes gene_type:complete